MQNPDPAEQRKGETTRISEQQRFTAIQENQRAVYDEIVKAEATPMEPDAQTQLAQDKGALLEQVQLLQGLGYEYTMGAPGQPVPCTYIYVIYLRNKKRQVVFYCVIIPLVYSTKEIYHRAAKWRDDIFDWSMTLGELTTQYNTTCYFYSIYDKTSGIIWWKKKVHNAIL